MDANDLPGGQMQFCKLDELVTESDVEQKLIFPLLTSKPPNGLGFSSSVIRTKSTIRGLLINKGKANKKIHYPDYLVFQLGLPCLVVEAKKPNESVEEAHREARLYATEVNALFPAGIYPVRNVLVITGTELAYGDWNSGIVTRFGFDDITINSPLYADFVNRLSSEATAKVVAETLDKLSVRPYKRPLQFLGGKAVRNEEVGHNRFGATMALDFQPLFNPETPEERNFIARNAYIPSKRRERYTDPIERILRAAAPPSVTDPKLIEDTGNPVELVKRLRGDRHLIGKILLLVGGVGAGKTTFVDYFKEVKIPQDLKDSMVWLRFNMNFAPLEASLCYEWIYRQIAEQLRIEFKETDFDDLSFVQKIFATELNRVKKALALLSPKSEEYRKRLTDKIMELLDNPSDYARALCRHLCGERAKGLVIVLDNPYMPKSSEPSHPEKLQ